MSALSIIQAVLAVIQACAPAIALLLISLYGQRQKSAGAQLATAQISAATASTEMAIAQAEVAAPSTQVAVIDRLKAGTF